MSQELKTDTFLQGGKYKIEKTLGQGSFGITYLGRHTDLDKKVAVKEFFMKQLNGRADDGSLTGMSDSSLAYNYFQKFRKEAINLSRLEHPNIVRAIDSFAENGTYYYVMDFIEGQDLNHYLKSHRLSEAEAVGIIQCVADAIIYMHEKHRMLHLDLKPGNIMRRDSDGHIFLIDFGLSKHFDESGEPESSTNIGLGTAGYAPIEQGDKTRSGEFRPTIDVYALGATFYKLLTGETPPEASALVSDSDLVENNLRAKGISQPLIAAVTSAMKPNVKERPQSVRAFKELLSGEDETTALVTPDTDLEPVLHGADEKVPSPKPASSMPHPKRSRPKKPRRKSLSRVQYIAIGCIILSVLVGVVGFSMLSSSEQESEEVAEVTSPTAQPVSAPKASVSVKNVRMTINDKACYYTGSVTRSETKAIPNGQGEAAFDDGFYYKGPFSNGLMHGDNAYYKYPNGDTFRGSFTNNLFTKGKYIVAETGEYFEGTFDSQGQPKKGAWYSKNGTFLQKVGG